jgi:hypothetical protein
MGESSFLEEQLKRIREMTAQVSRARARAAHLEDELARDRANSPRRGPLQEVRDLRIASNAASWKDDGAHPRRDTARHAVRRRVR